MRARFTPIWVSISGITVAKAWPSYGLPGSALAWAMNCPPFERCESSTGTRGTPWRGSSSRSPREVIAMHGVARGIHRAAHNAERFVDGYVRARHVSVGHEERRRCQARDAAANDMGSLLADTVGRWSVDSVEVSHSLSLFEISN